METAIKLHGHSRKDKIEFVGTLNDTFVLQSKKFKNYTEYSFLHSLFEEKIDENVKIIQFEEPEFQTYKIQFKQIGTYQLKVVDEDNREMYMDDIDIEDRCTFTLDFTIIEEEILIK
jgi:hypothetical protein